MPEVHISWRVPFPSSCFRMEEHPYSVACFSKSLSTASITSTEARPEVRSSAARRIFLKRSSTSPLYCESEPRAARSTSSTEASFRNAGTSPSAILVTNASTSAVLPTPASPVIRTLDLVLRPSASKMISNSFSKPMITPNLPSRASFTLSMQNLPASPLLAHGELPEGCT